MKNLQKLLSACAVVVGIALAAFTSSFTVAPKSNDMNKTYYYSYTGSSQTPAERSNGANYTNPQETPLGCDVGENECSVAVSIPINSTAPSNISGLSITYDVSGFPSGGDDLLENYKQD